MKRCEECGQYKPVTDDDVLAARIDHYRSAHGMLKDLYNGEEPSVYNTLMTARFLAAEPIEREDDDDD
jgi:hypothetical protein